MQYIYACVCVCVLTFVERMLQKGQIPWSHLLEVEAKGGRRFDVITPARTYYLESDQVDEWLFHIKGMLKQ
jgi:PH domain